MYPDVHFRTSSDNETPLSSVNTTRDRTQRLRVVMISEYPRNGNVIGGVQSAVSVLCNALSQHPHIGSLDVVSFSYDIRQVERERVNEVLTVHHIPAQKRFAMATLNIVDGLRLGAIVRRLNPDVVHAQGLSSTGFLGVTTGRPTVATVHGVGVTEIFYSTRRRWLARLRAAIAEMLVWFTMRYARAVIVPSEFSATYYRSMRGRGFVRIPNPVHPEFFRERTGKREPRIVFAGVVIPIKNVDGIIRAFARVKETVPDARLDVVGPCPDPAYRQHLEALIRALGVDDVHFAGSKKAVELAETISTATAVVVFSHHENVPCVIAEALATGTPVVAARVGGIPEMIEDGRTGFLIEAGDERALADQLTALLTQQRFCAEVGKAGREVARQWHPGLVAEATVRTYRKMLNTACVGLCAVHSTAFQLMTMFQEVPL